jgi:HSP20 family protein
MAIRHAWQELDTLRHDINRAFDGFGFREPFFRTAFLPGREARRYPLINMYEDKEALYVEALAPGVDPASMELTVVGNVLTITGEKYRVPEAIKPESYHRSERATGRFVRSIELPTEVDEDKVQADYRNGLLVVTLPKSERVKPKQINVKVA